MERQTNRKLYEQFNHRKENQRNDIKDWLILIAMLLLFGLAGGFEAKASTPEEAYPQLKSDIIECRSGSAKEQDFYLCMSEVLSMLPDAYEMDEFDTCMYLVDDLNHCSDLFKKKGNK